MVNLASQVTGLLTIMGVSFTLYVRPTSPSESSDGYRDYSYGLVTAWTNSTVKGWMSAQNPLENLPAGGQIDLYQRIVYLVPTATVKEHDVLKDPDARYWEVLKVETEKLSGVTQYHKLVVKEESQQT